MRESLSGLGSTTSTSWEFPAIEALGDAVVVVAVDVVGPLGEHPSGLSGTPGATDATVTLRLVYANQNAEKVFDVRPEVADDVQALARIGEVDRILAVASGGHPDSWVSRHVGGWFELRAARLTRPGGVSGGAVGESSGTALRGAPDSTSATVLVVARDLGTVSTIPSEAAGATRVALLLEISRQLGAAVREDQVAQVFFDLVCPVLGAEPGLLAVVRADGAVTVLSRDPHGDLRRRPATPDQDATLLAAVHRGSRPREPLIMPGADQDGRRGLLVVTVPLRAGVTTVGAVSLPLSDGTRLGRGRQEFIDTVAALVAQAVQRARLFDAQLEASLALQHALLPPVPPTVAGIELAARYRAGSGHEVGGDWYDVVPLDSGWVAFVIGDVQGHDLPAAALMGQVRSVIRAYLLDELPPSAALTSANAFLLSLGVDRLVTVCIALVHPRSRLATLATAGHACPLLVTPSRRGELLEVPEGPPLGVLRDVIWRERTTPLPGRATLVLYTDGLIERRHRPYSVGENQLLELSALLPDVDAEGLADAVLAMAGIDPPGQIPRPQQMINEDDTALVLLRWRDGGPRDDDGGHVRTLPVAPASAVIARWYVDDLLRSWGIGEQTRETATLLTDEIVANAVQHAHRTIRLDVAARAADVLVEVFDDSHREPRMGELQLDATSGRGLRLVDALATEWGIRVSQGDLGKTVWFALTHPDGT